MLNLELEEGIHLESIIQATIASERKSLDHMTVSSSFELFPLGAGTGG